MSYESDKAEEKFLELLLATSGFDKLLQEKAPMADLQEMRRVIVRQSRALVRAVDRMPADERPPGW